jgi:hypothetical protein
MPTLEPTPLQIAMLHLAFAFLLIFSGNNNFLNPSRRAEETKQKLSAAGATVELQ